MEPLENNLYFVEAIQSGGTALNILMKIKQNPYKYLRSDIGFEFELNDKNTEIVDKLKYLTHGSFTVVFGITFTPSLKTSLKTSELEIPFGKNIFDKLILRVSKENSKDLIEKYKKDRVDFGDNMIDIYMYGEIFDHLRESIGYYTITKEYLDYNSINKLNLFDRIDLLIELTKFLDKTIEKDIFYRDLKYANIGAEILDNKIKFILLDYDEKTLKNKNDYTIFNKETFGTYQPIYIISDNMIYSKTESYSDIVELHNDKMWIGGFIDILLMIFKEEYNESEMALAMKIKNILSNSSKFDFYNLNQDNLRSLLNNIKLFKDDYKKLPLPNPFNKPLRGLIYYILNIMNKLTDTNYDNCEIDNNLFIKMLKFFRLKLKLSDKQR